MTFPTSFWKFPSVIEQVRLSISPAAYCSRASALLLCCTVIGRRAFVEHGRGRQDCSCARGGRAERGCGAPRRACDVTMTDLLKPRDAAEVEAAVQWALGENKTLEIVGHGSKRGIGRAAQWDLSLDLSDLSGVTLYEPDELVLSAKA